MVTLTLPFFREIMQATYKGGRTKTAKRTDAEGEVLCQDEIPTSPLEGTTISSNVLLDMTAGSTAFRQAIFGTTVLRDSTKAVVMSGVHRRDVTTLVPIQTI